MDHEGHRSRMRTRYLQAGLDAFAPHEILELILMFAIPRRDTKPIAYALLNRFGSLHTVLQAAPEELMQVEGIGESAAILLSMYLPVLRRYRRSVEEETPRISNHLQTVRYCESLFEGERFEKFYVICLDAGMRRVHTEMLASGDITQVHIYARHLMQALINTNSMGAIITHNHPSGSAEPSAEDVALTIGITQALDSIGLKLYDHLIVSNLHTFSFKRAGLLYGDDGQITVAAQQYERLMPAVKKEIYQSGCSKRGEVFKCPEVEDGPWF